MSENRKGSITDTSRLDWVAENSAMISRRMVRGYQKGRGYVEDAVTGWWECGGHPGETLRNAIDAAMKAAAE